MKKKIRSYAVPKDKTKALGLIGLHRDDKIDLLDVVAGVGIAHISNSFSEALELARRHFLKTYGRNGKSKEKIEPYAEGVAYLWRVLEKEGGERFGYVTVRIFIEAFDDLRLRVKAAPSYRDSNSLWRKLSLAQALADYERSKKRGYPINVSYGLAFRTPEQAFADVKSALRKKSKVRIPVCHMVTYDVDQIPTRHRRK